VFSLLEVYWLWSRLFWLNDTLFNFQLYLFFCDVSHLSYPHLSGAKGNTITGHLMSLWLPAKNTIYWGTWLERKRYI